MGDDTKVRRLPGDKCVFFRLGCCMYKEVLNPGYHDEFRCRALVDLEAEYDTFLDRAEAFHLDEEMASRIWHSRLTRYAQGGCECPDFRPGDADSVPGCAFALGFLCLKALPKCGGQCTYFRLPPNAARDTASHDDES